MIGPDSRYAAGPVFDQPDVIIAEIDPGRITEGHLILDTQGHYSRPDVFHLKVDDRPQTNVTFASQTE